MSSVKRTIKAALGRIFASAFFPPGRTGFSIVLMYHRVADELPAGLYDPAMFVTSETLEMHIEVLSRHFDVVPLDAILQPERGRRLCAITFDDGWSDNYHHAFPVLKKHGVPATIFIPLAMAGSAKRFWFQDIWEIAAKAQGEGLAGRFLLFFKDILPAWKPATLGADEVCALVHELKNLPAESLESIISRSCERLGVDLACRRDTLTREEMREMGAHGITFGAHGLNHHILTRLGSEERVLEVAGALGVLRNSGLPMTAVFSYPNGAWDAEIVSLVTKSGYRGALTTSLGCNGSEADPFLLRRIPIHEEISDSPSLLWFRLFQSIGIRAK